MYPNILQRLLALRFADRTPVQDLELFEQNLDLVVRIKLHLVVDELLEELRRELLGIFRHVVQYFRLNVVK